MNIKRKYRAYLGDNDFGKEAVNSMCIVADTLKVRVNRIEHSMLNRDTVKCSIVIETNPVKFKIFDNKIKKVLGIYPKWEEV